MNRKNDTHPFQEILKEHHERVEELRDWQKAHNRMHVEEYDKQNGKIMDRLEALEKENEELKEHVNHIHKQTLDTRQMDVDRLEALEKENEELKEHVIQKEKKGKPEEKPCKACEEKPREDDVIFYGDKYTCMICSTRMVLIKGRGGNLLYCPNCHNQVGWTMSTEKMKVFKTGELDIKDPKPCKACEEKDKAIDEAGVLIEECLYEMNEHMHIPKDIQIGTKLWLKEHPRRPEEGE